MLIDPSWERRAGAGRPTDDLAFSPAATMRIGVGGAGGTPTLRQGNWDADVEDVLATLARRIESSAVEEPPATATMAPPTAMIERPQTPRARREPPAAPARQVAFRPPAGPRGARNAVHERPQRTRNRLWLGAPIGAALLIAGVIAAVVLGLGNHTRSVTNPPATATSTPSTAISNTTTSTTTSTTQPPAPVGALSDYWRAIAAHDFATAYGYLAPGAVPRTESEWISDEQRARIQSAQFRGTMSSISGSDATVAVGSLITHDTAFGCRSWTGSYQLVDKGGAWLIARANITPGPC
jgi:hypothetical protein